MAMRSSLLSPRVSCPFNAITPSMLPLMPSHSCISAILEKRRRLRGEGEYSSLASDKDAPRGCATGSCCLCCGGHRSSSKQMAPSAPLTAHAPVPPPAFDLQSNGHFTLGFATQKLPGKSNLKQTSTIPPSTSSNGASSIGGEPHEDGERGQDEGERGSKVQWTDDYGKELTQVFEFEPSSDSDDSEDDDDDSDSSQSCTCVIQ